MTKDLGEVWLSLNRAATEAAIDVFAEKYAAKYSTAIKCLTNDHQTLLPSYDFPAEHWLICEHQTQSKACFLQFVTGR
jgi:putative transposase